MRSVFIHYHLYKNAGSSIDQVFRSAGCKALHLESEDPNKSLGEDQLVTVLRDQPDIQYISSHALKPPRTQVPGVYLVDILFLRHPIDRFGSIYHYSRASELSLPTEDAAKRYDMRSFARWMANETPWNFFDPQTSYLGSSGEFFFPPTERTLGRALEYLHDVRLLGTVEMFSASLECGSRYLRSLFPAMQLGPLDVTANANPARPRVLEDRISGIRDALGGVEFDHLSEALSLDIRLWEHAGEEVQRRHGKLRAWAAPG